MSHISNSITNFESEIQILYNRVLIQVGLSAFSCGSVVECAETLGEICSSGRIQEMIGQGISRNPTNQKEELRRLLPTYMHIQIETIETVYLMALMLIETPNMIIYPQETSKKQASRIFKKYYESYKVCQTLFCFA